MLTIHRPRRALIAVFGAIIAMAAFAAPASAAPYADQTTTSVSNQTPAAGSSLTFCGKGFQAGETVAISLENGTKYPSVVADSNGDFCTTIVLGASLTGTHTLTATGVTSGRTSSTQIKILGVGANAVPPTSTNAVPPASSSGLAFTGGALIAVGSLAVLLLLGGVVMTLAGRRRNPIA